MAYIVFGLAPPGLFLMRELVKTGDKVYAVGESGDIGFHSKYGVKLLADSFEDLQNVVHRIVEECKPTEDIKAFIASSRYLDLILREWPELFTKLDVVGPDLPLMTTLNRKSEAARLFASFGVRCPKFYFFHEHKSIEEFPIILKWNSNLYHASQDGAGTIGKTTIIDTKEELTQVATSISQLESKIGENLIFQRFVCKNVRELGYGAFFYDGSEKMSIVVEQARQYPRGVSSYAPECQCESVLNIKAKFARVLTVLGYTGFVEIDFLQDTLSGEGYLLDVNPRPWGFMPILSKKYRNFHECISIPTVMGEMVEGKVQFVDIHRDIVATLKEQVEDFSLKRLINDLRVTYGKNTVVNTFDRTDMKPFLWGIPKKVILLGRTKPRTVERV